MLARRIEIDRRTDVYSLAVVLYEAITGERPFDGSTTEQVLQRIMRIDPPLADRKNQAVPRDLAILCDKAMAKDPAHRFESAGEFANELRRVADGAPIETRPLSALRRSWRRSRRHRLPLLVGATAAAAAALTTGWWLSGGVSATIAIDDPTIAGAQVITERLDPLTWQPVAIDYHGSAPTHVALPLGDYRVWLVRGDAFAERTLALATEGAEYSITAAKLVSPNAVRTGMVTVQGRRVRVRQQHPDRVSGTSATDDQRAERS